MSVIIGLNFNHADSSACIIKNNKLEFAIEEEKINRVKHWAGLPINSIEESLKFTNTDAREITDICINSNPMSNIKKKIPFFIKNYLFGKKKYEIYKRLTGKYNLRDKIKKKINISNECKFHYIDHHLSHIASSFYSSGFEESLAVSIDGFGDFVSTAIAKCSLDKIKIVEKIYFPHSLGLFYEAMTQLLDFKNYGDEYKLMGLSSYGEPKYTNVIEKLFINLSDNFILNTKYFNHLNNNFSYKFEGLPNQECLINDNFKKYMPENYKKEDFAASIQKVYENIFFKILKKAKNISSSDNLCLAGGCALNSVANGKINKDNLFKSIYIPYAPGDAGGAIGSALVIAKQKKKQKIQNLCNPYLGSLGNKAELELSIKKIKNNNKIKISNLGMDQIYIKTAKCISASKIVGWFQDRIEFGQRALGNRSILADPRNPNIREIINTKIKKREIFRPFAPSVLNEKKDEWFNFTNCESEFMEAVVMVNKSKKNLIPSVVHVDNSCRVQVVKKEKNEKFYNLIRTFDELTKIPLLLNTSFNENEPIVRTFDEAINCFLRTDMDILVIDNYFLEKNNSV